MKDGFDYEDFEEDEFAAEGFDYDPEDEFGESEDLLMEDYEGDWEGDEEDFELVDAMDGIDEFGFLKKAWRKIKRVAKKVAPIAKKLAPWAGRAIGMALGGPAGAAVGGKLGSFVGNLEDEEDFYGYEEAEDEIDSEDEMDAIADFPPDAEDEEAAENMAHVASKTKKPAEAGALAAASAATLASKAPPKVKKVIPVVSAASSNVAQVMTKAPNANVLKKTLPTIQKRTIATLTKKAAKGKPVTPATVKRVMAKQAAKVLKSPKQIAKALAKNETKRRSLNKKAVMRAERFY